MSALETSPSPHEMNILRRCILSTFPRIPRIESGMLDHRS